MLGGAFNVFLGMMVIFWLAGLYMGLAERITGADYAWPQASFMSAYPTDKRNGYLMFAAAVLTFIVLSSGLAASVLGASPGKALFGIRYVDATGARASPRLLLIRMVLILLPVAFILLAGPVLGFVFGPDADSLSLGALFAGIALLIAVSIPWDGRNLSWINRQAGLRPALRRDRVEGA